MSTEHYGKICMHCGHDYALHHGEDMRCPKGGEAMVGRKQEWLKTVFTPATPVYIPSSELISDLSKAIQLIQVEVINYEVLQEIFEEKNPEVWGAILNVTKFTQKEMKRFLEIIREKKYIN